jgi:hypothetical protein
MNNMSINWVPVVMSEFDYLSLDKLQPASYRLRSGMWIVISDQDIIDYKELYETVNKRQDLTEE